MITNLRYDAITIEPFVPKHSKEPALCSMLRRSLLNRTLNLSNQLIIRNYHGAMKEAIVQPDLQVKIVDSEIPVPKDDEVVTKVVVSGSNPKDWKRPVMSNQAMNSGDDIAGVVHQVGRNVYEFKPGDRVAAFHQMMAPGGSFAEYAVSWAHTTFHIPNHTSFEGELSSLNYGCLTKTNSANQLCDDSSPS